MKAAVVFAPGGPEVLEVVERPDPEPRDGEVVIRPMMYLALSYDHRIVDGKEAVAFLIRVKECIESPERMLVGA